MLRKMLNFARIASIVALLLLLTGCDGITAKANDPLSEEEVIQYVCDKIREESGDEVTATIVSKTQLEIPTAWFDGPMGYIDVEGGHSYVLEVKNKEIEEIVANAYYDDGYTEYSSKKTAVGYPRETEPKLESNYAREKTSYRIRCEFDDVLKARFTDYAIYRDVSNLQGIDVFLLSSDYNSISSALSELNRIVDNYRKEVYTSFSVYIYKDEAAFRATDHTRYPNCTKDAGGNQSRGFNILNQLERKTITRISTCRGFAREYFAGDGVPVYEATEGAAGGAPIDTPGAGSGVSATPTETIDPSSFDYIVFWYDSEPNSSHNGDTEIFGVK